MGIFSVFTNIAPSTICILKENPPDYFFLMALQDGFKERCFFCKLSTNRDISGAKDIYSLAKSIKYNIFYSAPAYKTDGGAYHLLQDQDFVLQYQEFEELDFKLYGESKRWDNFDPSVISKILQRSEGHPKNNNIGSRPTKKTQISTEDYLKQVVKHVVIPIMQSWQKQLIASFECNDLLAQREAWILAVLVTYRKLEPEQQVGLTDLCFQEMKKLIPEQLLISIHNNHELPIKKFIQAIIDYRDLYLDINKSISNENKQESNNRMTAFCSSISARTKTKMNILIYSSFGDIMEHYLATEKQAVVIVHEMNSIYTIIQDTPPKTEALPCGRYNLAISSHHVMVDEHGQPDRLLINFKAEAPSGFVVPPATFKISDPVGQEIMANLLWAAGCREPVGLDALNGLCLSASLYMNKAGCPTWGSWEEAK